MGEMIEKTVVLDTVLYPDLLLMSKISGVNYFSFSILEVWFYDEF